MTPTRKQSDTPNSVAKKTVLSPEKKTELICRYAGGARLKPLATEYNIGYSTAHKICTDKKLKATLFECKKNFSLVKNLRVSLLPLDISEQSKLYSGTTSSCQDDAVSSEETNPKEQIHDAHAGSECTTAIQCKREQGNLLKPLLPLGLDKTLDSWVKSMRENCHPVTASLLVEKARQAFVEVTGSEEGFSDSCEWLTELKSKYRLHNGREIGKRFSQNEGNYTAKKKVFESESDNERLSVSTSKFNESSDVVPVKEGDSRDIPPNQATLLEKKKSSPNKKTLEEVHVDKSLSELKFVPKGQFKVKFNFHRRGVSFSPELKMNCKKRKIALHPIQISGAKKNSSAKLDSIKYDYVKKLAAKQNLGLNTAMDIHSDNKKLEAFMSKWIVKLEKESLQSLKTCLKDTEAAKLPLNEMKVLQNPQKLETAKANNVTLKASSTISQSEGKSSLPQEVVEEFGVKSICTPVDSVRNVKEHQDTNVNHLRKSENDQSTESKEKVKQISPVMDIDIALKGSEQHIEESKKKQVSDEKINQESNQLGLSVIQKFSRKKEAGFDQETVKKLALKYDISANTISGIRKDKDKLEAFLASCKVSMECIAVKWLISRTSEITILSEPKDDPNEIQDLERNSTNVELICKDVERSSNKISHKRRKNRDGEEVVAKKRGMKHSDIPKKIDSVSEDQNELRSFLSPCVVHNTQELDQLSSIDYSVETPKLNPLKIILKPHKQIPFKASAKSPKQRPVKASNAKTPEQNLVIASSGESTEQSPVVTSSSTKSCKQSPVKARSNKLLELSPIKGSRAVSKQNLVTNSSEKSFEQSPVTASSAELPEQSPVIAVNTKSPKQTPIKACSAKSPDKTPVKTTHVKSPKQSPVSASSIRLPEQSPVSASSAKSCRQSLTKATSTTSPKHSPVKVVKSESPVQASKAMEIVSVCQLGKPSDIDMKVQHNNMVDQGEMKISEGLIQQSGTSTSVSEQSKKSNQTAEQRGLNISMTGELEIGSNSELKRVDTVSAGLTEITGVASQKKMDALGIQGADLGTSTLELEESNVRGIQQSKAGKMEQYVSAAKMVKESSHKSKCQIEFCFDTVKPVMETQTPVEKQLVQMSKGENVGSSEVTVNELAENYNINHATVKDISSDSEKLKAFLSRCFVSVKKESMIYSQLVTEPSSCITTVTTSEPVSQRKALKRPLSTSKNSIASGKKGKGERKLIVKFKFF
ncbi:uncharacterized protein LOC143038100 isoform X2 [Oratosquilla oratoria]|uniref:uncharacterized protein LOC143038100 isoform X2 n=1 Tax=Oratosquilla oratoria TaxID=337810 RepID=UPI003F7587F8